MNSQDVLILAAELGIGLAGFASISAALRSRSDDGRNRFRRARVSTLIYSSLGVAFFAYLPMVLAIALEDEAVVWRSTSAIYGFWQFLALVAHLRSFETFRTQPDFSVGAVTLAAFAFTLSVALNSYNVFAVAKSWPFLASLACALVVAGSRFAQLVDSLWKEEQA